jgi:UDP-N-acetylglucosamine/UDP-N-acetylgalactosamine diphosphorylase
MAGGQGTRLGYKGPKGTYELDFEQEHCRKSLFEIMCENIKNANNQYNITLPWYIMTSEDNDFATKEYFKSHNFFDYPKEKIKFFKQEKLPIVNIDGKLILKETYLIKDGSNGNGNVFKAMKNNKIIDDLEKNNIKWVSFGGIDNILLKNIDPLFIGLTVDSSYQIASKSIFKQKPLDKVAVYCKKSGKPSILDYDDIDIKLSVSKSKDGMYQYREANILSHLMNLEAIKKVSNIHLPYHRAYKKNAFVNEEGMKQIPDKPNSFKFENFIFDSFAFFDDMLLLRVDENEEFAPIKDFTGIYNPDTAKEKYEKYWNKIKI